MSFGMIITHLVCIAHKFTRSRRSTRKASPASCSARTAALWNLNPSLICCVISLTNRWNGSLLISRSGPFQYFCISLRACIPHCTFLFLSFLSSLTTYICFSFWPLILRALFLFTSLVLSEAIFFISSHSGVFLQFFYTCVIYPISNYSCFIIICCFIDLEIVIYNWFPSD